MKKYIYPGFTTIPVNLFSVQAKRLVVFNLNTCFVLSIVFLLFSAQIRKLKDKLLTHTWPFSKSKFNLRSDRVNLIAQASPIECLRYLPDVRAIQYKLGPERLTRLGYWNVLRLPVYYWSILIVKREVSL